MTSVSRSAVVPAPVDAVWSVLADFGGIAQWVPMLEHSCPLSDRGGGVGAVRRVQVAGRTMVERVTRWDEGSTLAYTIEGLPPFLGVARNTWELHPAGRVTEATLTTEIDTGRNPAKRFAATKVLERMALASEFMLAGLVDAASAARTEEGIT